MDLLGKAKSKNWVIPIWIFLAIFFFGLMQYSQTNNYVRIENKTLESILENAVPVDYKPGDMRVFTNPPENITSLKSESWRKKGTVMIGNDSYMSLGSEIKLKIYEFQTKEQVDYDYILSLEKIGPSSKNTYFLNDKPVTSYSIESSGESIHADIIQNERTVYFIQYFGGSQEQAKGILSALILW